MNNNNKSILEEAVPKSGLKANVYTLFGTEYLGVDLANGHENSVVFYQNGHGKSVTAIPQHQIKYVEIYEE